MRQWVFAWSAVFLAGCQTTAATRLPARMVSEKMTDACLAQMQSAVQQKGEPRVVLGNAAFAQEDRLTVVPAELLDESGLPRDGRIRGVPDSYRLTKEGKRCVITRERDGKAAPLTDCSCVVMK